MTASGVGCPSLTSHLRCRKLPPRDGNHFLVPTRGLHSFRHGHEYRPGKLPRQSLPVPPAPEGAPTRDIRARVQLDTKQPTIRRDGVVSPCPNNQVLSWLLYYKTFGRRHSPILVGLGNIRDFLSLMRTCQRKYKGGCARVCHVCVANNTFRNPYRNNRPPLRANLCILRRVLRPNRILLRRACEPPQDPPLPQCQPRTRPIPPRCPRHPGLHLVPSTDSLAAADDVERRPVDLRRVLPPGASPQRKLPREVGGRSHGQTRSPGTPSNPAVPRPPCPYEVQALVAGPAAVSRPRRSRRGGDGGDAHREGITRRARVRRPR